MMMMMMVTALSSQNLSVVIPVCNAQAFIYRILKWNCYHFSCTVHVGYACTQQVYFLGILAFKNTILLSMIIIIIIKITISSNLIGP